MKKVKNRTVLILMSLFIVSLTVNINAAQGFGFYCMREKNHRQPKLEKNFEFILDYDGYYTGSPDEKVLYLTFDAGYENGNVEKIVDTLDAHNAKGAFFILENLIRQNTELVNKMANNGHIICNHTARHKDMTNISDISSFKKELTDLSDYYKQMTGKDMAMYYRPPEGKFSLENMKMAKELGYKTIFWSFAYADWDNNKQPDIEASVKKILENTHNGAVVLLHPTSATNAKIMDRLLCEWEKDGYRFGTLDELCNGEGSD